MKKPTNKESIAGFLIATTLAILIMVMAGILLWPLFAYLWSISV